MTTYNNGNITHINAILSLPSTSCDLVTTSNSLPIGCVTAYAGNTNAPTGWLFCDGSEKNKTDASYSALFNIIGYTYGGSGNTFNLPKMISGDTSYGIFPAGSSTIANTGFKVDNVLKIQNINTNQKISANQIPVHNHTMQTHTHTMQTHTHTMQTHTHNIPEHSHDITAHSHDITYEDRASYLYDISFQVTNDVVSGDRGGVGNFSFVTKNFNTVDSSVTTSGNSSVTTSGDSSVTTSGDSSVTTSSDSSVTTSGDSSATTTGNTPSSQNDYVPNYTAFLWVIKFN